MQAGAVLRGRYRIDRVAGTGGMGTVYRAIDEATGATCALKVLTADATSRARERFVAEAQVLAKIAHPAIAAYLDHGADPPFLVMEWVDGECLADRLARSGATPEETLKLGERLVRALAAVHASGVVHRDVKPRNVMLPAGAFAEAKIVDFGIARAQTTAGATKTGVRVGTPRYMAPEQIVSSRRVDGRADVFSLGCVLFEMLTGRKAFRGHDEIALLARMVIEDAPRVRSVRADVPVEVDALVARLLTRDFKKRPFATDALADEIASIASHLRGMSAARATDEISGGTAADETPDDLVLSSELTPLPPPSELPWATIGRDAECLELLSALATGSVVGLWGALGVGKSHLAQEIARRSWSARAVVVCELRGSSDAGDVVRRVATELGIVHAATIDNVCAALAGRDGPLVVLDGCEEAVLDAAIDFGMRVVDEASGASVLVTSRERPPVTRAIELGPLDAASSKALFVARARGAANPQRDASVLESIAASLEGNPLALTLAASRASVLGLGAIATRLERPLDVLGSAKTPAYPMSLRDALAGAWDALAPLERVVAAACAIFPGPMRPELAERVCAAALGDDAALSAIEALEALRDKSLLRPSARETLTMDPALRDLARQKQHALAEGPDGARIAHAKNAFARGVVERGADSSATELFAFEDDLLAAFEIAAAAHDAELALSAALALEPSLGARGPLARLASHLDRAVALATTDSITLARAIAARGRVASLQGETELASRAFERCLAMAERLGDAALVESTWLDAGVMHQAAGNYARAAECYAKVLGESETAASVSEARARGNLGALAHDRGELDVAYTHYVRAIAVAESIGDSRLLGVFLCNLAVLDRERGRPGAARHRFVRALHALEEGRQRRLVGIALGNLGMLELEEKRTAAALDAFARSAEKLAALGDAYSEALAQARLAAALAMTGNVAAAEAAIARGERLAASDAHTLAIVRFFRAFPERARERAGDPDGVFAERIAARIASVTSIARHNDDVRGALRVLEAWV